MAAAKNHAKAGGRKAGVPNKVTRDLREIAQTYTAEAIHTAAAIMRKAKAPESARLTAVTIILERGHGKAAQAVKHSGAIGSYDLSRVSDDALRQLEDILGSVASLVGDPSGDSEA
jgi:phage terminase small subunit